MAQGVSETVSWNRSFLSWVLKVEKEFARKIRKDRQSGLQAQHEQRLDQVLRRRLTDTE